MTQFGRVISSTVNDIINNKLSIIMDSDHYYDVLDTHGAKAGDKIVMEHQCPDGIWYITKINDTVFEIPFQYLRDLEEKRK